MKARDIVIAVVLAVMAAFIWMRDPAWASGGQLPLVATVAFVLCWWLGRPWQLRESPGAVPLWALVCGVILMLGGIVAGLTSPLAAGWTLCLYAWLRWRFVRPAPPLLGRLMFFPLLGFPWITLDLPQLGWWFRQSGAWAVAHTASVLQMSVVRRQGVHLLIEGQAIVIDPSCAGMNVLEAMLVAGGFLVFTVFERSPLYWPNLLLLPVLAWVANTLRVLCISLVGVWFGAETAMGVFHDFGGWLVLILMFVLVAGFLLTQRAVWKHWHPEEV